MPKTPNRAGERIRRNPPHLLWGEGAFQRTDSVLHVNRVHERSHEALKKGQRNPAPDQVQYHKAPAGAPDVPDQRGQLFLGEVMRHGDRNCDIGGGQPIADRIGAKNRYWKPPARRVQVDADRMHAKLRLHLLQQRAVSAADIQNRLHGPSVAPQAFENRSVVPKPPVCTGKVVITALAHIFRYRRTVQNLGLAGTLSDVSSEHRSLPNVVYEHPSFADRPRRSPAGGCQP